MIRVSLSKIALTIMLFFLFTTGCGVFQERKPHYNSCGPIALSYAFRWHDVKSARYKISKEILKDHKAYSLLRDVLSVFSPDLNEITFPQEMKDELVKYNIKTRLVSLGEFKELKKDRSTTAIILLHPKNKFGKFHWLFYPTQSDSPSSFFGSELQTVVDKIYILTRTNIN